ncbi:50S ribosomal protein L11 methyltransferase [Salmonella enterica subsp. enterica]|nr:50S ribosomal protein L11 methyltransferase [Salmonella enterica subsp. enterica]
MSRLEQHPQLPRRISAHKSNNWKDKDWEREWILLPTPMRFWRASADLSQLAHNIPDENAVNVMLDRGLAFGTRVRTTTLFYVWVMAGRAGFNGKTVT